MLVPMLLVPIYPYALILGPSIAIILAACIALLVRSPSSKLWISAAMVIIGAVEISYMPLGVIGALWLLPLSLVTINLGIIMSANILIPHKWRAKIGLIFTALGIVLILSYFFLLPILYSLFSLFGFSPYYLYDVSQYTPWAFFVVGICTLVFGVAAGANGINPRWRAEIDLLLTGVGACMIVLGSASAQFGGLAYLAVFLGPIPLFAGISIGVAALPFWTQNQPRDKYQSLRRSVYVLLAAVIVASGSVIFLRETNVVHEQILATYDGGCTPNLILRGMITEVRLNYEVNNDYFYHIFPAYIVINDTEFVWGSGYTSAPAATVVVYHEKTDVPSLTVGQRVEVCGYFNPPREDSFYEGKLSVTPSISGSYVKLL